MKNTRDRKAGDGKMQSDLSSTNPADVAVFPKRKEEGEEEDQKCQAAAEATRELKGIIKDVTSPPVIKKSKVHHNAWLEVVGADYFAGK